jgi:phosphoglucosamine mutase
VSLGVVPTPAVAWVATEWGVPAAVISASHNPFGDNGVKLFTAHGRKLDDTTEAALEAELRSVLAGPGREEPPTGASIGAITTDETAAEGWLDAISASIDRRRLDGTHVVIDCANGAVSAHAPELLRSLGATVTALHAEPDGVNINDASGSTHPAELQEMVVDSGANIGIAFDGDADRCLAVDAQGRLVDGDQLIAICAIDRHKRGRLPGDAVVVTVMTNLGFRLGMDEHGIRVVETPVGDRHVLAALDEQGLSLGGEQSGHIIFRDLAVTGDGLLTAVQVLDLVTRAGLPLAELADAAMTRLPQVLRNVRVGRRSSEVTDLLADEIAAASAALGDRGRVLVRASGTEPLIRVMVEAPTEAQAVDLADRLVAQVEQIG